MQNRLRPWSSLAAAALLAWCASACRMTTPYPGLDVESAALLGVRNQAGWENSTAPLIRVDAGVRPQRWPVGVQASSALTGFFGDEEGEQTFDFGLGVTRTFTLAEDRLAVSAGLGHLWLTTDNGELFGYESDNWQANYVEAGLYVTIDGASAVMLGLEARYATGDGPRLDTLQLDGEFLDLYLVLRLGSPDAGPALPVH